MAPRSWPQSGLRLEAEGCPAPLGRLSRRRGGAGTDATDSLPPLPAQPHRTSEIFMSRVQLGVDVADLGAAVDFCATSVAARVDERTTWTSRSPAARPPRPPTRVATGASRTSGWAARNHLGVETANAAEVLADETRLSELGFDPTGVHDTVWHSATKTETWATDPAGTKRERYLKSGDAKRMAHRVIAESARARGARRRRRQLRARGRRAH